VRVRRRVTGCGVCYHCVRGRYNLCQDWHHIGLTIDGALAEYAVVPVTSLFPLPASVSLENAAFLEPLATVMNTLERVRPLPGTPAAVIGPGPFGLLHVQALRAAGAGPILVFGRPGDEARLEVAHNIGADEACVVDHAGAVACATRWTDGIGMELVIETAGTSEGVQTALEITAGGGTLATLGLVRHTEIDALQVMRKAMTWVGVVAAVRRHWAEAIRLVAGKRLDPSALITHRLPLAQALDGFTALRAREAVKVMYEP
jgi:threonine dehydrogenase-like Zn-dependent dehydrogenase